MRGRPAPRGGPAAGQPDDVDRRIAGLVAERIPDGATHPGRHRLDPQRRARRARRPPRPRHPHRAALRRPHRPHRAGRRHRRPQASAARARSSTTFALGTARLYDFLDEQPGGRAPAGRPGERSTGDRPRARLRLDQRDHARSTSSASAASETVAGQLLVVERRPGRLRPRRDVLADGGQAFIVLPSTAARRHGLPHPGDALAGLGGHDAQEHRRPRRHRARRGRPAGPRRSASGPPRSSRSPTRASATTWRGPPAPRLGERLRTGSG